MDKLVNLLVGLGIPGIILAVAMAVAAAAGLSGAAVVTAALAMIGPGGMIAGVVILIISGVVALQGSEFCFDSLAKKVTLGIMEKENLDMDEIFERIDKFKVSNGLKLKIKDYIERQVPIWER